MAIGDSQLLHSDELQHVVVAGGEETDLTDLAAVAPPQLLVSPPLSGCRNPMDQIRELLFHGFCEPGADGEAIHRGRRQFEVGDSLPASPESSSSSLDGRRSGGVPFSSSFGLDEPAVILQHYKNLKKALQYGFCDPESILNGEEEESGKIISQRKKGRRGGCDRATATAMTNNDGSVVNENEEGQEEFVVVVTRPGEGSRRVKIIRVLEIVFFFFLILFLTFAALHRFSLDGFQLMEVLPKDTDDTTSFAILSSSSNGMYRVV